ncbi:Hpt domain-containing protein [Vibrio makurazakiensis]|uniref:quorum-sensing phosphorelay protein LuxU n=1 Tax=Vibrio makurazakiensis TaxID=2910250 RepID=UPI003D11E883
MKILNQQKIDELAGEIGQENVPVLLNIFLGELNSYVDALTSGTLVDIPKYLAETSHALKSSAASFGADRLCGFAIDIDARAKDSGLVNVAEDLETILGLLRETETEYQSLLVKLG